MKSIRLLWKIITVAFIASIMVSCSSEGLSDFEQTNQNNKHVVKMELVGNIVSFDHKLTTKSQTKSTSTSWTDGDKIFIAFHDGTTIIPGEATYSSSSGWSVCFDGYLPTGSNLKCEARYFVNATYTSSSLVSLNYNSEIYEDTNATYIYDNEDLIVTATLSPKTGRIRFTGDSDTKISLTGITTYSSFAPTTNTFSVSKSLISTVVSSSGSTPYIYGYFTDNGRSLGLIGEGYAFTRTCTTEMFNTGESGRMAIPSENSHNKWRKGLYIKASGIEFKMVPVAGYSEGFFLMAETETTAALYYSVTGSPSTSQLPVLIRDFSYQSYFWGFISALNKESNLKFHLPTLAQWLYAAKGGNKSQGFTYAGSNNLNDVAWHSGNCSSVQEVKKKIPNELGLYDMSGNLEEMTSDYYVCGGGYETSIYSIPTSYHEYSSNDITHGIGFRLSLSTNY